MAETIRSFMSDTDLSALQFHAVVVSGEYTVSKVTNGNAQIPLGILANDPTEGQMASVVLNGITRARVGGSVSAGNHLSMNNTGELIAAPQEYSTGSDLYVFARALEDGANDEIIDVELFAPILNSTE